MKKLNFTESLKDTITIGVKNFPCISAVTVLWLLTIWIPSINIGTTIALCLLPAQLSEGKTIRPLSIFEKRYRGHMSDFFLTAGMVVVPITLAMIFMFFPGIVLSLAWSLSFLFLIERDKHPIQAIRASNKATCGSKWTMSFVLSLVTLTAGAAGYGAYLLCKAVGSDIVTGTAIFIGYILMTVLGVAVVTSFWKQLKGNAE